MGLLLYIKLDSTHQRRTGDVLCSLKSSLLRSGHAQYGSIPLTHRLSQSVARLPASALPPHQLSSLLSFLSEVQQNCAAFMNELSLFFFYE